MRLRDERCLCGCGNEARSAGFAYVECRLRRERQLRRLPAVDRNWRGLPVSDRALWASRLNELSRQRRRMDPDGVGRQFNWSHWLRALLDQAREGRIQEIGPEEPGQ